MFVIIFLCLSFWLAKKVVVGDTRPMSPPGVSFCVLAQTFRFINYDINDVFACNLGVRVNRAVCVRFFSSCNYLFSHTRTASTQVSTF